MEHISANLFRNDWFRNVWRHQRDR